MLRRNHLSKILLFSIVSLGTFVFTTFLIVGAAPVVRFLGENSVIELATALGYLGGFVAALYALFKLPRAAKYPLFALLWAVLCFVFFGEETSWLQHIIGYGTPASIEGRNLQGEFNFHNLEGFMTTNTTGGFHELVTNGNFNIRGLLSGQNLFRLGFFSYFIFLPLLLHGFIRLNVLDYRKVTAYFPLPRLSFVAAVSFVIGLSLVVYVVGPDARQGITEVRELFYALFILFYIYAYLPRPISQQSEARAAQIQTPNQPI